METDNTRHIIDAHLENIQKSEKSKIGVLSLSLGIVAIGVVGIMGFSSPKIEGIVEVKTSTELIIELDDVRPILTAVVEEVEIYDIVATISPTSKQMEQLKESKEGRKVIQENKKRKNNKRSTTKSNEETNNIGLTQEEILMLEEAELLGENGEVFKQSELKKRKEIVLPVPFNNPKLGVSNKTYSAEEVKELNTVYTGYMQKSLPR